MARHAAPIGTVVADTTLGVAVQLIGPHRVQPAGQHRTVPDRTERMQPGRGVGAQVIVVGPALLLVRPACRQHRHPARHAQGRWTVDVVERDPFAREAIEIRRRAGRVAVAARDALCVLVREQEQQVRTLAHSRILS